ncbi:3-ketoacyl-CoA thiolase, mitochondrial-like [Leptidea sinapis]|uniref:3-ketoacyl-CoA thiolase, mitochondrial-like n=1 Tax=Leptidea sinapis TaxID=189913 RepID=UPI0021C491AA|nr:3-ketoacyl-CoA thiolase, mitochondrial-like [Leptidea sinapis]
MALTFKKGIFIVAAKRTPFGKYGGALKDVHPSDLFATAARQALTSSNIDAAAVDTVNVGHVFALSCSGDGALSSRHGALKAGIPQEKPAMSVNVQCGSGLQALISSAQDILTGAAQISLCGGTENMSGMPFLVRGANLGIALGATLKFEDALTSGPDNTYCDYLMAQNAEKLAEQFSLKRGEVDEFALQSHRKWKTACDNGVFGAEMAAVTVKTRSKEVVVDRDEHPSPGSDVHELCKLPVIHKRGGVVTVGNSARPADGAAAVVVVGEAAVSHHQLCPLARVVASCSSGRGVGPAPAIRELLRATDLHLEDIDLIEMNESFAAQTVACIRELEVDADRVNVNGGALALGHPVAASGARIIAHLVHQLRARGLKRAIASAFIGDGLGIALLLESV